MECAPSLPSMLQFGFRLVPGHQTSWSYPRTARVESSWLLHAGQVQLGYGGTPGRVRKEDSTRCGYGAPRHALEGLEAVPQGHLLVRFTSTLICSTGSITVHYRPGAPASEPHEVALLSSSREPGVGEGVPETVGVYVADPGLTRPSSNHLGDA